MDKRTHADETSTVNMENDSFGCLVMVIFHVFCFEDVDSAHQKFGVLGNFLFNVAFFLLILLYKLL